MDLFTPQDFKVFDLKGFHDRMSDIALRIRPKLNSIGESLVPTLSSLVDRPLYFHVAKHARRTVNPPDDTWVAFGANSRGYKKDVHFKVAVSRHCVRFLLETGPEYYAKGDWALAWRRNFSDIAPALRSSQHLAWFKDEHDEYPVLRLKDMEPDELEGLGEELTRRRDGQLVFGRQVDATEIVGLTRRQFETAALDTFKALAPLFRLHEARVPA